MARDIRNNEEEERRHQENLKSAELNRKTQVWIAIISLVVGAVLTLLIQSIVSLFSK
jgi:hypothetical protein